MVMRRCPQCGSTTDDIYGFCIKCGHEFPKIEISKHTCPLCGFQNPDEADFCVKCGTPLVFKNPQNQAPQSNETVIGPIVIERVNQPAEPHTSRLLILLGYLFSILGGILGLIIAIYLSTRKDPVARKHGHIQLAIFVFYIVLIAVLYATGNIPPEVFTNYRQMILGNFSTIKP
ncbi:double zinc ribbon domain-containing protein [Methanobrevibacter sp.]|uniref:zinc ribbon domain-containing protein n=1 Tax=Methanobrevibacter sp. TaxID=66852 RepID=UPI00388F8794